MSQSGPCIVVLAGRRVDKDGAVPVRFPLANVPTVRERLKSVFEHQNCTTLVTAAAAGVDLIGLQVAGELGMRRRILLALPVEHFRTVSVADRPGDWGPVFDRIIHEAESTGDVTILGDSDTKESFMQANRAIIREAAQMANDNHLRRIAVIAWDGQPRGADDVTADFKEYAADQEFTIIEISTLD